MDNQLRYPYYGDRIDINRGKLNTKVFAKKNVFEWFSKTNTFGMYLPALLLCQMRVY